MRIGEVLTMAEYIKREYAVDAVLDVYCDTPEIDLSCEKFEAAILKIQAEDVAHVVHGRWVKIYENGEPAIEQHQVGVFCSRCMKMPKDRFTESDFCPNCGAKMDLEG